MFSAQISPSKQKTQSFSEEKTVAGFGSTKINLNVMNFRLSLEENPLDKKETKKDFVKRA